MHQPIRVQDSKMFLSQSSSMEHATGHSSLDSSIIFVAYFVRPVPLKSSVGNLKLRNSFGRGFSCAGSPSAASSLTSSFFHAIISDKTYWTQLNPSGVKQGSTGVQLEAIRVEARWTRAKLETIKVKILFRSLFCL